MTRDVPGVGPALGLVAQVARRHKQTQQEVGVSRLADVIAVLNHQVEVSFDAKMMSQIRR